MPAISQTVRVWLSLLLIIITALFIRYAFSTHKGYEYDVGLSQSWGQSVVEIGIGRSYQEQINNTMIPNYPPFSLMLFGGAAWTQKILFGDTFDDHPLSYRILIKTPAILVDVLCIVLIFFALKKWRSVYEGLLGALIFALHPAVIHDGAIWGQTDVIFTFFMTTSLMLLSTGGPFIAGAAFALAVLSKMQAVQLAPLLLLVLFRSGWRNTLLGILGGLVVTLITLLPFVVEGTANDVVGVYTNSVGFFSTLSTAAYNFWHAMFGDQAGAIQDTATLFNLYSYRTWGLLAFGLSYIYALFMLWPHIQPSTKKHSTIAPLFIAGAFICYAFFLWNTQMHERYLFPFVLLGIPMVFVNRRGAYLYGCISAFFYFNLLGVLSLTFIDRALFATFPLLDSFIASVHVVLFFLFARFLYQYSKETYTPQQRPIVSSIFKRVSRFLKKNSYTSIIKRYWWILAVIAFYSATYLGLGRRELIGDEGAHFSQVTNLIALLRDGTPFHSVHPAIPAYHFLLALAGLVPNTTNLFFFRAVTLLMSVCTIGMFHLVAKRLWGKDMSIFRTLQFAFLPIAFPFFYLIYTDIASIFPILLCFYFILGKRYYLAGISSILAIAIRQNNVIWILFLVLILLIQEWNGYSWRALLTLLKKASTFALSMLLLALFILVNGGVTLADKSAHPLSFHTGNFFTMCFFFSIMFFPLLLLQPVETYKQLASSIRKFSLFHVLSASLYIPTFSYDHQYRLDYWWMRNKILALFTSNSWWKLGFYGIGFLPASMIAFTSPLKRASYYWIYPFSFLYLGLSWLIDPRYFFIPLTFFILFRKKKSRGVEIALLSVFVLESAVLYYWALKGITLP